jgi:hypothetical protein
VVYLGPDPSAAAHLLQVPVLLSIIIIAIGTTDQKMQQENNDGFQQVSGRRSRPRARHSDSDFDQAYYLKIHHLDNGKMTLLFTNGIHQFLVDERHIKPNYRELEAGTPHILSGLNIGDENLHDTMKTYWATNYELPPARDANKSFGSLRFYVAPLAFSQSRYEFTLAGSYGFGSTTIIFPEGVIPANVLNGPFSNGSAHISLGLGYRSGKTTRNPTSTKIYPKIITSTVEFLDEKGKPLPAAESDYAYKDADIIDIATKLEAHAVWGGRALSAEWDGELSFLHLTDQGISNNRDGQLTDFLKMLKPDETADDTLKSLFSRRFERYDESRSKTKILMLPDLHQGFTTIMAENLAQAAVSSGRFDVWIVTVAHPATTPANASALNSGLVSPSLTSQAVLLSPEFKRAQRTKSTHWMGGDSGFVFKDTSLVRLMAYQIDPPRAKIASSLLVPFTEVKINESRIEEGYDTDLEDKFVVELSATPYALRQHDILERVNVAGGYKKIRWGTTRANRHQRYSVYFSYSEMADRFLEFCSKQVGHGLYALQRKVLTKAQCVVRVGRGDGDPDKFLKVLQSLLNLDRDKIYALSNLTALIDLPLGVDIVKTLKGLNSQLKTDYFLSVTVGDTVHDLVKRQVKESPRFIPKENQNFPRPGHLFYYRVLDGLTDLSNAHILKIQKGMNAQSAGRVDHLGCSTAIFAFDRQQEQTSYKIGTKDLRIELFYPTSKVTFIKDFQDFSQIFPDVDFKDLEGADSKNALPPDLQAAILAAKAALDTEEPRSPVSVHSGTSSPKDTPPSSPKKSAPEKQPPPPSPSPKHKPEKRALSETPPNPKGANMPKDTSPPKGKHPTEEEVESWDDEKVKEGLSLANISFDKKQSPQARKKVFQLYLKNLKRNSAPSVEKGSISAPAHPRSLNFSIQDVKGWSPQRLRQGLTDAGLEFDAEASNKVLSKKLCDFLAKQDKEPKRGRSSPGTESPRKSSKQIEGKNNRNDE